MKGRDKVFKCIVCGLYIKYDDIPDNVKVGFTPDSEITIEATEFTHKKCDLLHKYFRQDPQIRSKWIRKRDEYIHSWDEAIGAIEYFIKTGKEP